MKQMNKQNRPIEKVNKLMVAREGGRRIGRNKKDWF